MSLTYDPQLGRVAFNLLRELRSAPIVMGYHEFIDFHFRIDDLPGAIFFNFDSLPSSDVEYVAAQLVWYINGGQTASQIRTWRPEMWA